ncbi:MAG: ABC transporter permease [Terracidiphilus sp.]
MPLLSRLFHRQRRYNDLSVSIQEHIAERADELVEEGMPRAQAEQTARREFGNVALIEQRSREVWQWRWLEQIRADLKFSWRQALSSPRFTVAVILTLAIGIGAQTTIYSVIQAVLIDPFPYRDAMRMVHFHLYDKDPFPEDLTLTGAQFVQFQKSPVLDGAIAQDPFTMALTGSELPEQLQVGRITPNAFPYLGVPTLLGRAFTASDTPRVAVLSNHFFKSHFAGRSNVVGQTLQLDHQDYTILGVMPPRFAWMGSDVYIPLIYSSASLQIANVFGRIRAGVSDEAAEQALQPMLDTFQKETPANFPQRFKVHVVHINEIAIGRFKGVLVILFVSVSFLLMLACINAAILLVARGEARRAEIAMRKALGASRRRIVAQLLTEALLLSCTGGSFGVLVAFGGIRLVRYFIQPLPSMFPAESVIALSVPVLFFSLFISILTGLLSSLWPAARISRTNLRQAGDAGTQRVAGKRGADRIYGSLLACQVALSILLLACSGATLRKLSQLIHANLGYAPHNLSSFSIELPMGAHNQWADRINYYEQIRKSIAADPDIETAAIGTLPPSNIDSTPLTIPALHNLAGHVNSQQVSPDFFTTLRIPLIEGRVWSAAETSSAARLALVNQAMQRRYWPGSNPIGQTIVLNNGIANGNEWKLVAPGDNQRFQIIGIVGDSPNRGLGEQVAPAVYLPYSMTPYDGVSFVLRTRAESAGLLHSIKERVHAVDSSQAVGDLVTANQMLEGDTLGRERFVAGLFSAFAFLGLAFAVSGLYSVQSYLVTLRKHEFGVRIALGAQRSHILRQVTRSSTIAVLAGTTFGISASLALSNVFAQWTSGNSRDPLMLAAIAALLLIAAASASIAPAMAATSIEPAKALRAE